MTVNGDLRTLRRILKIAAEWGKLAHAPAVHELPQPKGRDRVLSFREEALYLAKASDNLRDATILAVDTGMRPNSELFPLLWADVDLTARTESPHGVIHVARARRRAHGAAFRSLRVRLRCYSGASERRKRSRRNPRLCFPARATRDTSSRFSIRTKRR